MELYRYIKDHTTPQGEALDWVERQTNIRTNHARMLSGAVQGRFLMMVTEMIRPKRILELGTFTGYSSICLASCLPVDGHLDTLEINDELEDLILEGFGRAGLSGKITLHIGDCKETLRKFNDVIQGDRLYDMVYMDANKREYPEYYDLVFGLVRPGGYILVPGAISWRTMCCGMGKSMGTMCRGTGRLPESRGSTTLWQPTRGLNA